MIKGKHRKRTERQSEQQPRGKRPCACAAVVCHYTAIKFRGARGRTPVGAARRRPRFVVSCSAGAPWARWTHDATRCWRRCCGGIARVRLRGDARRACGIAAHAALRARVRARGLAVPAGARGAAARRASDRAQTQAGAAYVGNHRPTGPIRPAVRFDPAVAGPIILKNFMSNIYR
ncbi:hypothetical protein EVAR_76899_1 [Eumeta japonica]|uniref:Uncharacterized protein n=1 Tax=Eumeta variegata TaxID=151549 RepID=A0A4C1SHM8_EUMVA|nr:hypothetical protein EVAR_76899_1 [Eumeta japonica]